MEVVTISDVAGSYEPSSEPVIEPEIPMAEADFLKLLDQHRTGRYIAKKGVNIEKSPNSVIWV